MGELILETGVLGPMLSADVGLFGVLVYGEARVGVLEALDVWSMKPRAGVRAGSSLRLDGEAHPAAAARVCLEGPMIAVEPKEATGGSSVSEFMHTATRTA